MVKYYMLLGGGKGYKSYVYEDSSFKCAHAVV